MKNVTSPLPTSPTQNAPLTVSKGGLTKDPTTETVILDRYGNVIRKKKPKVVYKPKMASPRQLSVLIEGKRSAAVPVAPSAKEETGVGADPYAVNLAKMKVPSCLWDVKKSTTEEYKKFNDLDEGAKIYMLISRASTRFGSCIPLISMYSRGLTTSLLQMVMLQTSRERSLPRLITSYETFSIENADAEVLKQQSANMNNITVFTTNLMVQIGKIYNTLYPPKKEKEENISKFLSFWNCRRIKYCAGICRAEVDNYAKYPQDKKRQDKTPYIVNEPFYTFTNNKIMPNLKLLLPSEPKLQKEYNDASAIEEKKEISRLRLMKKADIMRRRGLGQLTSALELYWSAIYIYATVVDEEMKEEKTLYHLPVFMKNLVYAGLVLKRPEIIQYTKRTIDDVALLKDSEIKDIVKKYYYCSKNSRTEDFYMFVGFSIAILQFLYDYAKRTPMTMKNVKARDIERSSVARTKSEKDLIIAMKNLFIVGDYLVMEFGEGTQAEQTVEEEEMTEGKGKPQRQEFTGTDKYTKQQVYDKMQLVVNAKKASNTELWEINSIIWRYAGKDWDNRDILNQYTNGLRSIKSSTEILETIWVFEGIVLQEFARSNTADSPYIDLENVIRTVGDKLAGKPSSNISNVIHNIDYSSFDKIMISAPNGDQLKRTGKETNFSDLLALKKKGNTPLGATEIDNFKLITARLVEEIGATKERFPENYRLVQEMLFVIWVLYSSDMIQTTEEKLKSYDSDIKKLVSWLYQLMSTNK